MLVLRTAPLRELRQRRLLHATRDRHGDGSLLGVQAPARLALRRRYARGLAFDVEALMAGPWRMPPADDPWWIQHWRDVAAKLREWAAQNVAHFGRLADEVADIQKRNAAEFERKADALETRLKAAGKGASDGNPNTHG
jgi:hypothetical protein